MLVWLLIMIVFLLVVFLTGTIEAIIGLRKECRRKENTIDLLERNACSAHEIKSKLKLELSDIQARLLLAKEKLSDYIIETTELSDYNAELEEKVLYLRQVIKGTIGWIGWNAKGKKEVEDFIVRITNRRSNTKEEKEENE